MERFEETLILLKKSFGWFAEVDVSKIMQENVNRAPESEKNHITPENFPRETIEMIKQHNLLDLQLYQFAICLFEEQLKSFNISSQQQTNSAGNSKVFHSLQNNW